MDFDFFGVCFHEERFECIIYYLSFCGFVRFNVKGILYDNYFLGWRLRSYFVASVILFCVKGNSAYYVMIIFKNVFKDTYFAVSINLAFYIKKNAIMWFFIIYYYLQCRTLSFIIIIFNRCVMISQEYTNYKLFTKHKKIY